MASFSIDAILGKTTEASDIVQQGHHGDEDKGQDFPVTGLLRFYFRDRRCYETSDSLSWWPLFKKSEHLHLSLDMF